MPVAPCSTKITGARVRIPSLQVDQAEQLLGLGHAVVADSCVQVAEFVINASAAYARHARSALYMCSSAKGAGWCRHAVAFPTHGVHTTPTIYTRFYVQDKLQTFVVNYVLAGCKPHIPQTAASHGAAAAAAGP
jgi:hypothetical protein